MNESSVPDLKREVAAIRALLNQTTRPEEARELRERLARAELSLARRKAALRTDASEEWYWSREE